MNRPGLAGLTHEQLLELYVHQRLSYRAIARELGCSDSAVANAVRRLKLVQPPAPPKQLDPELVREMVRLYTEERLDLRGVAARTSVGLNRVGPILRGAGVRLRKRGSRPEEHLDPQQLRADYEGGASIRFLAERESCNDGAIRDALVQAGAVIRERGGFRKWSNVLTEDFLLKEYVGKGRTTGDIAAEVGCHDETVAGALRGHGIQVRPGGSRR